MKTKKITTLLLTLVLTAVFIPFAGKTIAQAATFTLPLDTKLGYEGGTTHAIWEVGETTGLTAEMLMTANRLEVRTSQGNTSFNSGKGLGLYCNGGNNGYWDEREICEVGQNPTGVYTFNLEWKRGVFTDGNGNGLALGDAWWGTSWNTLKGSITSVTLVYGEDLRHTPIDQIGTPLNGGGGPSTWLPLGDINNDGVINAADATMLRRYLASPSNPPSGFNAENAKITGEETIVQADLVRLREYLAASDPSKVRPGSGNGGGGYVPVNERPICKNAKGYMAITFDDGPIVGPSTTGATAAIFESFANSVCKCCGIAARATWFVNPIKITKDNEPLVQRMVALGHDIENHTWSHGQYTTDGISASNRSGTYKGQANVSSWSATEFRNDLTYSSDIIERVTGRRPKYFRFPQFLPGGSHSAIVNELGMYVIHAQFDLHDYRPATTVNSVVKMLTEGGMADGTNYYNVNKGGWDGINMLFHDAGGDGGSNMYTQQNAQAFAIALPMLMDMGYAMVTVEEMWTLKGQTPQSGGTGATFNGHTGPRYYSDNSPANPAW